MTILGRLLGTEKAIDNILDKDNGLLAKAGGWLNDLGFTAQERADWTLKQLSALEPFKVVQRIIAGSVLAMWLLVGVNLIVAIWVRAVTVECTMVGGETQCTPGIDAVSALWNLATSDYIFWPTVSVLSLYITGGLLPGRSNKS